MNKLQVGLVASATLALLILCAGCGSGTGITVNERATDFAGGALSSFGGADGDTATARATARDLMVGREFDLIGANYQVVAGGADTVAAAASARFSGGMGTVTVNGDEGMVELEVFNVDPAVVDAALTGYFSVTEAQRAVSDAGASFLMDWEIEFTEGGVDFSLTAQQILAGANWVGL